MRGAVKSEGIYSPEIRIEMDAGGRKESVDEFQYQIDLLKAMNQKADSECRLYRTVVDTSGDAFLCYRYEDDTCLTMGNWDRFFAIRIKNYNDMVKLLSLVRKEDAQPLRDILFMEETGSSFACCEFYKTDTAQWVACQVNLIRDMDGTLKEKLLSFRDITKFRKENDDLAYLAYYDSLTGLYNRNRFIQELTRWISGTSGAKATISVAYLNLNEFRKINEIGALAGDELLRQFGQFLKGLCTDDEMMCARLGADGYCFAIYDPYGDRTMEHVYRLIEERLQSPFFLTDSQISVTVSVGVAEYPEAGTAALELIERAEMVMFRGRQSGRSEIRYFDAPVIHDFTQNARLESKLKSVVFEREFLLYYQPQYGVSSGEIRGVEALIRWRDEEGHIIRPGEFIPIAEKSSLMIGIGEWVIEKAVSTLAEWKKKYGVSLIMSLNISAGHFVQEGFAHRLMETIRGYEITPKEVELEITETALLNDFARIHKKLELLKQYGIQTAIDHFGLEHSSFSCLRGLPVHAFKLDKTFVDGALKNKAGNIIAESMVKMINRLGYETIAEGVEQQEQLDYLKKIGCKYMQGYLCGKPMPGEQIEELLERQIWE